MSSNKYARLCDVKDSCGKSELDKTVEFIPLTQWLLEASKQFQENYFNIGSAASYCPSSGSERVKMSKVEIFFAVFCLLSVKQYGK